MMWEDQKMQEIKEIKYLGFILQKNGAMQKHIKERIKRAMMAMKKTWSIGERETLFKKDFRRRIKMFERLTGSVALFGPEI